MHGLKPPISLFSLMVQPCLCLCLGFVLQNTNKRPLRRTMKQSLQRLFRAVLVFIPALGWKPTSCWQRPSRVAPHREEDPEEAGWLGLLPVGDESALLEAAGLSVDRLLQQLGWAEADVRANQGTLRVVVEADVRANQGILKGVTRCLKRKGTMVTAPTEGV